MVASFRAFNQSFSCRGGLVLPVSLDFSTQTEIDIDLTSIIDTNIIDFVSTVYVNLKDQTIDLSLVSNLTRQLIFAEADSIGYFPLMLDADAKIRATASAVNAVPVSLIFSNIPFYPFYQKF